ncbi:MAG: DedA family protein [Ilumatobacteraceae bacterium]|nr:DedA family protein [Ilumatobacteraceae bacterium]
MVASIISDVTDWIESVSSNWWFLLVIFTVAFLDSVFPVVPGETTVIIGGVAAGTGNQQLILVIFAGALGAFLGDNLAYLIGRRFEGPVRRWAGRKPARLDRLDTAGRQIKKRGGMLLITARFIPGGRTVLTISSGITHQPRAWFAGWVAIAGTIWATYAAGLGFLFGQAFEDNHSLAFWLAFGTALAITGLVEVVRWVRERRKEGTAPSEPSTPAPSS